MPIFQYEAMNSTGQTVKGKVEAESNEEAVTKIRSMGNFPIKVKAKAGKKKAAPSESQSDGPKGRKRTAGKVATKILAVFTRQLSTLQDAGLPLLRSLRILQEQQKPGPMKVAARMVADDVESGTSLSESMGRQSKAFNRLYVNMVRAGELGGVLDLILKRLADFMERAEALKRKVKGAMVYPVTVLTFAFLIVAGLMWLVVPKFKTIFDELGAELPNITKVLVGISTWMAPNFNPNPDEGETFWIGGIFIIIASIIGLVIGCRVARMSQQGAYFLDRAKLSIPIMGNILRMTIITRFCRTLGTLLSAGVPILEALSTTAQTAGNLVYERALMKVHGSIKEGESIAKPLSQARVVDSLVVNMVDVGEETGELDQMLERVANDYEERVDTAVGSLVSLLEPVMIVTLGGIVGFIVVALFMPMIGMLQAVQ